MTRTLKSLALTLAMPGLFAAAAPVLAAPAFDTVISAQAVTAEPMQHGRRHHGHGRWERGYGNGYSDGYRAYDRQPVYQPVYQERSSWRGDDGRYYCRRSDGTTGLVVGAAVGGLIGNETGRGRGSTTGLIIGAAAGALLGREVDRGGSRCR